jgi:hypothetical protein
MSKPAITAMSFVVCLVVIIEYYFKIPSITALSQSFQNWAVTISAFALGVGCINLCFIHVQNIRNRRPRADASVVLLGFLGVTFAIGLFQGMNSPAYEFIFGRIYAPLIQSSAGLLIFYVITAALRAFRLRNLDAWVLLIATTLVMLGNAPFGSAVFSRLPLVKNWILTVPNMAGQRAVIIGGSLGIIATAFRTILGIEVFRTGSSDTKPS